MPLRLLGAQAVMTRFSGRLRLQPRELLTIYVRMLLASVVPSPGPLEMMRGEAAGPGGAQAGGFLKNHLTWVGFSIAVFLFGLKGLHQYMPSFPDVTTDVSLNDFFTQPPYNQMGFFHIYLSVAAIG